MPPYYIITRAGVCCFVSFGDMDYPEYYGELVITSNDVSLWMAYEKTSLRGSLFLYRPLPVARTSITGALPGRFFYAPAPL